MAQADFILRIRSPSGTKRFSFPSNREKFSSLQQKVYEEYGIAIDDQLISRKPIHDPELLMDVGQSSFASLGLKHGDMLYLIIDSNAAPASMDVDSKQREKPHQLTSRCQHAPQDRCIHCASGSLGVEVKGICDHPPSAKCINCSTYKSDRPAVWLCNHGPHSFCPNCLPEEKKDINNLENPLTRLLCQCRKGQSCIHCANKAPKIKVDLKPYRGWLNELRAMCHFKHSVNTSCIACAPPEQPNFKGNPKCTDGHRPWPHGICSKCMPANARLKPQPYRHCDGVSFEDEAAGNRFVSEWLNAPELQRAAIMFGTYIDEPEATENEGAIRAVVQSLYYPPQENLPQGVRFLRDPKEATVLKIAQTLGLEPVGWVITTLPREDEKYGGEMLLSGPEVRQAAKFQNRFKDEETGLSKFVTMVIKHNSEGQVEPVAYQVSDQCMALERDGVLTDAEDIGFLGSRVPKRGESVPSIIYKDKQLNHGEPFLPDEFIVKVVAMRPYRPQVLFQYVKFPYNGTVQHLKAHLAQHAREDYHIKLSDFNLLCFLPGVIGQPLTLAICEAIKARRPLSAADKANLERALRQI